MLRHDSLAVVDLMTSHLCALEAACLCAAVAVCLALVLLVTKDAE